MEELSNRRLLPIDMASYAGVWGGPVGRLSRRQDVTEITGNTVLVNYVSYRRKNFSKNYLQYGRAPSKVFAGPVIGRRIFESISFKGRQVTSPAQ